MLREVFETDVSRLPIGPIFKGRAQQDSLTLENGTDRSSQNVGFKPPHAA
jgi:hypothetical protein